MKDDQPANKDELHKLLRKLKKYFKDLDDDEIETLVADPEFQKEIPFLRELSASLNRMEYYQRFQTTGKNFGRVHSLGFITDQTGIACRGLVIPIEAYVAPAKGVGGKTICTGSLRVIARESVQNVSTLVKKLTGIDLSKMDVHINFLGAHGVDGDSFAIPIATAIMSDLSQLPVRQDLAMTGSLSVDGQVLPVDEVSAMIEGAANVGIKNVIIPFANMENISLDSHTREKINIKPVKTLDEVLTIALIGYRIGLEI